MFTLEEMEEFKEYLEIHRMSEGESFREFVVRTMAKAFLGIVNCEIKSQSSDPLLTKQTRCISTTLVTLGPSVELDVPPMWVPQPSNKVTELVSVPFLDPCTMQDDALSLYHLYA